MTHYFIINPAAGKHRALELEDKIRAVMVSIGEPYDIIFTEYAHHAIEIVKSIASKNKECRFYACGGDGTLFDVVNGACEYENAAVGVIPYGSGNDFTRSFEYRERFLDIRAQVKGSTVPLDIIRFEDMYSCNVCSLGMDAEVVNHKSRRKLLSRISGPLAYNISVFTAFVFNLKNKFRVCADGEEFFSGDCALCSIANGKYYGGGFKAAPDAVMNDGIIDLSVIESISHLDVLKLLPIYKKGLHTNLPICHIKQCRKVSIECEKEMSVNLDGELFRRKKAEFEIIPGKLKFILPAVAVTEKDGKRAKSSANVKRAAALNEQN